ncbi:non-ribosomal peptide synthetase [Tumebacillus lipolyticus]|uniref:Amino acid adenylation domain-containing protein n=1 Tax=Tumebacillus lipolyticus TaxID=1280370 RepID=A0ABW5A0V8_9BACL
MSRNTDLTQRRSNLSAEKRALLEKRLRGEAKAPASATIAKREPAERAELSFAQSRLWFLDRLQPGNPVYNVPSIIRMEGRLRYDVLELSLNEIIRRHEALRTTFHSEGGIPYQAIAKESKLMIRPIDIEEEAWRSYARQEVQAKFDLEKGPLIRVKLLRLSEEAHIMLLTLHHIVADGWSLGVLLQEVTALYEAFYQGKGSPLPELPIQYADYAKWLLDRESLMAKQLTYWKEQLGDRPATLQLATDRLRPPKLSSRGAQVRLPLADELTAKLHALCEAEGVTLFMLLTAAFHVLLHRYTGQDDISIGTPIAGRSRGELEGLIGLFINSLSLRVRFQEEQTFQQLLQQVRKVSLDAFANQDIPFERLVEELQVERNMSQTPLFQALFRYLPELFAQMKLPELTWLPLPVEVETAMFDLSMAVGDTNGSLTCMLDYSTDLFAEATVAQMLVHYRELLISLTDNPRQKVSELNLIDSEERRALDAFCVGRSPESAGERCVHQLFAEQASRTPNAAAVQIGDHQVSYATLLENATALAERLRSLGIGRGDLVSVRLGRSPELITSILAILQTGAGYVPIDPAHPVERQQYMINDAGVCALIASPDGQIDQVKRAESVMRHGDVSIYLFSDAGKRSASDGDDLLADPIYVLYTSGTTGQPKGVVMPHRAICNLIEWQLQDAKFAAEQRTLQYATITFDVSVQEIFSTLCSGGTLVLVPEEVRRDPMRLLPYLAEWKVERLFLPYVAFQQLAEAAEGLPKLDLALREIYTAGDQLQLTRPICRLLDRLTDCTLYNHYGPTESHVVTSYRLPAHEADNLPPIGRPIDGAALRIVDANNRSVPLGIPGELCIGGLCLADGYLNRPELTAERFLVQEGKRYYKTGDRVRLRADGNLEYLGRLDHQVKIRGYRIEPGEIESVLRQHQDVLEAAVVPHEFSAGDKRLVAYLVARAEPAPTTDELRGYLQDKLPDYMLPSLFLFLEAMPLNANRKLDRRALPSPVGMRIEAEETHIAPRDSLEVELVKIWEELLGVTNIGVRDNFFTLGGHSLLAVRLMTKISSVFEQALPLATLFEGGTIEHLAGALRRASTQSWYPLIPIQPDGDRAPLFCVHPVGGSVFCYTALSESLGTAHPVYGLQACGLEAGEQPLTRIEELAAAYIEAIRTVRPQGPYRIAAWSLGGTIAFEMAHQLQAQGEQIELLALFDSLAPLPTYQLQADELTLLATFAGDLMGGAELKQPQEAIKGEDHALQLLQQQLPFPIELDSLKRLWEVFKANIDAYTTYRPIAYGGDLLLFRSDAAGAPDHGWKQLITGEVQVIQMQANHYNMLQQPHVQSVADAITDR